MSFLRLPLLARTARTRVAIGPRLTSRRALHVPQSFGIKPVSQLFLWGAAALVASTGVIAFGPTIHLDSELPLTQVEDDYTETISPSI
jgi:hypothetical protein